MRAFAVVCTVALAGSPAFAQDSSSALPQPTKLAAAKSKAAKPAHKAAESKSKSAEPKSVAVSAAARAAYLAMSESDRMAIQSDLIWTSDYNGMIGSDFGERAIGAVKAFQKRHHGAETGVLSAEERAKLSEEARPRQERVGWQLIDDQVTGTWLGLPIKMLPKAGPGQNGSHWQSNRGEVQIDTFRVSGGTTTLAAVFEQQKKTPATRRVEYQVSKPDYFVISGLQGVKLFYVRAHGKDNDVRGVTVLYDQAMEGIMESIVVAMSNAFTPFPTGRFVGPVATAIKRKVEYGTGIIVSEAGHIITDRDVTEDCQAIVVSGFGHADRIADDKTFDLALLQVHGARALKPAPLGGELPPAAEATLIGIADPQMQGGGSAVSAVAARLMPATSNVRPVEPTPALGFAGSAAVDKEARFLGMVGLRPGPSPDARQAAVVPADVIRRFLDAQRVAPHVGSASVDAIKTSIVRVICVRK